MDSKFKTSKGSKPFRKIHSILTRNPQQIPKVTLSGTFVYLLEVQFADAIQNLNLSLSVYTAQIHHITRSLERALHAPHWHPE